MRPCIQRLRRRARELDRDLADLAPELLEDPVALGPDLVLGLRDRGGGLALGPCLDLGAKLLGRLPRLLDDAVGLLAAFASCSRYSASSCSACVRVCSARSRSPWILSRRSSRSLLTRGSTHFQTKKNRTANASAPTSSSSQARVQVLRRRRARPGSAWARDQKTRSTSASLGDDERERDAEQRQGLDQPDADEHRRSTWPRTGLARHRLDGMPDQTPSPTPGRSRRARSRDPCRSSPDRADALPSSERAIPTCCLLV